MWYSAGETYLGGEYLVPSLTDIETVLLTINQGQAHSLSIRSIMADNTSKRRRASTSKQDRQNIGQQTHNAREPSQRAGDWHSTAATGSQTFDNSMRSTETPDPSMIGKRNAEGKMLLQPLPRRIAATSRMSERNRTTHACEACRKAKAKCTSGQPCQKCKNEGKECVYGDGKREQERKVLQRTSKQNETLKDTLRDMLERINLSESDHNRISELLARSPSNVSEDEGEYFSQQSHSHRLPKLQGEMDAAGDAGSTGSLDAIDVDTNRDPETRATGFLGKSSSARWIQRAEKEACEDGASDEEAATELPPTFYPGDPDLCEPVDQGSNDSWKYEMPPPETARSMVDFYFVHVHPDFPILFKDDFMRKFQHYSENRVSSPSESDNMALCQINCVFAISCTAIHLIHPEHDGDYRDHLVYYARTRALGLEQQPDNARTSMEYIGALGLLGLYLVSNYYINRAWNTVGLAIRNAITLGLHIRSEASRLSDLDKELRIRVWWSLFSLEGLLNQITGRPSCISYRDISAPHPFNYGEEQLLTLSRQSASGDSKRSTKKRRSSDGKGKGKNRELENTQEMHGISNLAPHTPSVLPTFTTTTHFIHRTALNVLTNEILNRLFCAAVVNNKWSDVQEIIGGIDTRLQKWKSSLPEELRFTSDGSEEDGDHRYEKKGLAVMYYTARMILHRPALCKMEGRIKNESTTSQKFNREAVTKCVESARSLLATIGKPDDPTRLYLIQPWWEILHHVCQAAGILMLEISFCACHIKHEAHEIMQDAKDAVHWLRAMSQHSVPARRAWEAHNRTLRMVATKIGADVSDMATAAEAPPGWYHNAPGDHGLPISQATLSDFDQYNQGFSENQSQNLDPTSAWVQQNLFPTAAASQPDMNQAYASAAYPNQPIYYQERFEPSMADPFAVWDSPNFPRYGQHNFMPDLPQEMQDLQQCLGNVGAYQPFGSAGMGTLGELQEGGAHSSQLQASSGVGNTGQGYQNVEDQYPAEGVYGQQWHHGGGGSGLA